MSCTLHYEIVVCLRVPATLVLIETCVNRDPPLNCLSRVSLPTSAEHMSSSRKVTIVKDEAEKTILSIFG